MGAPAVVRDLSLREHVRALERAWRPLEGRYLAALKDGSFEREDFVETQIQFLSAVVCFPRPMAMLASRLPRGRQRLPLLDNAYDEHGRGELSRGHEHTFRLLLERLGVDAAGLTRRAQWPEVRAFNAVLEGVSLAGSTLTGLAVFGIIEHLFAGISHEIGRGIISRGWLASDELVHYPLHAELDEAHADGFFLQLEGPFADNARAAYEIDQGLQLGGHVFLRLFDELHAARKRRAWRSITGPHDSANGWDPGVVDEA